MYFPAEADVRVLAVYSPEERSAREQWERRKAARR